VDDEEILEIVTQTPLEAAPERLIELANDRGGDDNITAIVIQVS
jgi:protein phosphatase